MSSTSQPGDYLPTWIKICGVTRVEDARLIAQAGADAIGLNFVPSSKRCVALELAADLTEVARGARKDPIQVVGVFADQSKEEVCRVHAELGLDAVQLHGAELPTDLNWYHGLGISAFKAMRIGDAADVERAEAFPGDLLLVDAKVGTELGGTGHTFDWSLIADLGRARRLILAGGLTPDNVADAVTQLNPFGVDTASGVESAPGIKDEGLVFDFVQRCRRASATG